MYQGEVVSCCKILAQRFMKISTASKVTGMTVRHISSTFISISSHMTRRTSLRSLVQDAEPLTHIRELSGWNVGRNSDYSEKFRGISEYFYVDIRRRHLP
jgi:hypothetical protein